MKPFKKELRSSIVSVKIWFVRLFHIEVCEFIYFGLGLEERKTDLGQFVHNWRGADVGGREEGFTWK
jgi:hypothetical protein